jgi:hypothetical protein
MDGAQRGASDPWRTHLYDLLWVKNTLYKDSATRQRKPRISRAKNHHLFQNFLISTPYAGWLNRCRRSRRPEERPLGSLVAAAFGMNGYFWAVIMVPEEAL